MNKIISNASLQELAALAKRQDSDIDFSDIPETTIADWDGAKRGQFYKPIKQQVTVRIDADILGWLKHYGKGYQSRLNSILRQAMLETSKGHK